MSGTQGAQQRPAPPPLTSVSGDHASSTSLAAPTVSPRLSSASGPSPRVAARATVTYTATVTVEATAGDGGDGEDSFNFEEVEVTSPAAPMTATTSHRCFPASPGAPELSPSVAPAHSDASRALGSAGARRAAEQAAKGQREARGPAIMAAAARGRTRALFESKVLCSGTLLASRGAAGGERGRAGLLEGQFGAEFRPRWFAIVAFDRGGLMDARKRFEVVLLWTATESKFEQLLEQMQESDEVPNSYRLRLSNGSSALRLPQVLGSLALRSAKKVMESRRLDLPDSLFSAIEVVTIGKKYLLGVEKQDDLSRWLHALRASHRRMRNLKTVRTGLSRVRTGKTDLFLEEEETEYNKWTQEVGMPTLFHILWYVLVLFTIVWICSLIWLFNPYLAPCRHKEATYAVEASGQCFEVASGALVEGCLSWRSQAAAMGSWRSWVSDLQSIGLFDRDLTIEGESQTCFEAVGGWKLFWFWGFVVVEIIGKAFALGFSQLNWKVVVRGAQTMDEMEPAFPERAWPDVDILLCHYSEPAEETMETFAKMLEMDYPASKLHIYICDDGYFKSDFREVGEKPGANWPEPQNNHQLIQLTGDVRQLTEDLMAEYAARSDPDGVASMASDRMHSITTDGNGQRQALKYKKTDEVLPEPSDAERRVPRTDCAVGYVKDTYSIPGMPRVSYVARLKPRVHHAKAGNINNALYNVGARGQYAAIFDNDMQPHPMFLTATLPLFFEEREEEDAECPYTDDPDANGVAYVQTPQYFRPTWLMSERGDPLSHANAAFFDSGLLGMDGYDSAMFVGTNCVWRREALDSVGGVQYGTVSEDYWTGYTAQAKGWNAAYMRKDRQGPKEHRFRLSEGKVPESVAASMAQRKRWHKGSVQLFLGAAYTKDPEWVPPPARTPERPVPGRVRRYRQAHYALLRLAWLNVFPPLFYTALVIGSLWSNTLWLYLNPLASYVIMIPFMLLASFVPSLGDITVPTEQIMSSLPEYFTYAPVRLVSTLEVFYCKISGRVADWGNTGGIKRGSWNEVPILLFVVAISVGLVRSVVYFFFFEEESVLSEVMPIWAFACYLLLVYWNTARVSIQECLEWGYDSLCGALVAHWLLVPGIMAATVLIQWKETNDWKCS